MKSGEVVKLFMVVLDFFGIQENTGSRIIFHDLLTAATIFNKDICKFGKGNMDIELESKTLEAITR